ncbi:hypothetical protein EV646_109264 [Kribbella antiqua]|uniref:Uncharacterized protein n=1 Tax=Kribbella antiqua TaxID=2512217 RepID=A0A4R2IMA0_9ACTN|nr:hypothetical protein [Kribbella antiqua]TCO45089.1 hypothetical protein EV646_109264 [Kribbella antiqua]
MTAVDWTVLVGYFVLMVLIGLWSRTKIKTGIESTDTTLVVALPLATSLVVYVGLGLLLPERRPEVDELVASLNTDPDEVTARPTAVNLQP